MHDLISRQAVLRILNLNMSNGFYDYNHDWWDPTIDMEAINEIKALPSAQPEEPSYDAVKDYCRKRCLSIVDSALLGKYMPSAQRWIPCSERLPEDEEEVIVSVRDDSGDNTLNYSSCGWYACAGDFWVVDNEANERVIAWCPFPEPYKEKE